MQNTLVNIQVNGKKEQIDTNLSIHDLLIKKGINPNVVACELNLKIVKRIHLSNTKFQEGDVLEVIQMIGGG